MCVKAFPPDNGTIISLAPLDLAARGRNAPAPAGTDEAASTTTSNPRVALAECLTGTIAASHDHSPAPGGEDREEKEIVV